MHARRVHTVLTDAIEGVMVGIGVGQDNEGTVIIIRQRYFVIGIKLLDRPTEYAEGILELFDKQDRLLPYHLMKGYLLYLFQLQVHLLCPAQPLAQLLVIHELKIHLLCN